MSISGPFTPSAPEASTFLRQVAEGHPVSFPVLRLSGEDLDQGTGRNSLDTGRAWFSSNGYRHAPILLKETGQYRIRFKVGAQQVGEQPVQFEARMGDLVIGPFPVTAEAQAEQWIETQCELPAGLHDWQVWFVNEFQDPQTKSERWFWLHEFTIEGPLDRDTGMTKAIALRGLNNAARKLFRRPLDAEQSEKIEQILEAGLAAGMPPRLALGFGLETLLISPKFLYHVVPQPAEDIQPAEDMGDGTARVDEFTLANRLAYFLWSSAPDDELFLLAQRGGLRDQLRPQVERMLRDPKAEALTANFAGQWLQLRNMEIVAPDATRFPEFDADLANDMRRETELVFEFILRGNRPVLEFLTADYSFLNPRLAAHYGLPSPPGNQFERIELADPRRRGVVTHASLLTMTSLPTRTSPIKRGKWVLEQFFGVEPPPAPADVPPLPPHDPSVSLSLRQRLESHSRDPSCAACHALLDPIGFALENYDPIGRWRSMDEGQRIDPAGKLVTGETFKDWSDLRRQLATEHQDAFIQSFAEQLLTYALGRGISYRDKPAIRQIIRQSEASNHGFQDIIHAICQSVPFQRMRNPAASEDASVHPSPE